MLIAETSFEEILPVWKNHLWPGRKSPIEKASAIRLGGGYNMAYLSHPAAYFICKSSPAAPPPPAHKKAIGFRRKIIPNKLSHLLARSSSAKENPRGGQIAGVLSCFATEAQEFRMRGLYVFPQFRKQGLATALVEKCRDFAIKKGGKTLWTLPRESKKAFYKKRGFTRFFGKTDEYEFGPHLFAIMDL